MIFHIIIHIFPLLFPAEYHHENVAFNCKHSQKSYSIVQKTTEQTCTHYSMYWKEIWRWWTLLLPVRDSRKMPILQQVRSKDGEANTARWKCVHAFIVFIPLNFPTTRTKDAIPQLNPEGFLNLLLFPHTLIFNTHFHLRAMLSILVYVQMFFKQDSALKKMMKKNSSPYLQGFCLGLWFPLTTWLWGSNL